MNEKLQYATMLEIPVNTCNVRIKEGKKRKRKVKKNVNTEEVKNKLIDKINASEEKSEENKVGCLLEENKNVVEIKESEVVFNQDNPITATVNQNKGKKKKFSFSIIGAQVAVIGVLVGTIFLTNAFYPESGINAFFNQVFSVEQTTPDTRTYKDFAPVLAVDGSVRVEGGVITLDQKGSVYSPCDGEVVSVALDEGGKYKVEIEHGKDLRTTFTGLDYAYCEVGSKVFKKVPVGYLRAGEVKMCFLNGNGLVISDYTLDGNSVVWAV